MKKACQKSITKILPTLKYDEMTTQELIKAFDGIASELVVRYCLYYLLDNGILRHRYHPTNKVNPPQYSMWRVRFFEEDEKKKVIKYADS